MAPSLSNSSLVPKIYGMVILDNNGKRICAKYTCPSLKSYGEQIALEGKIFRKTRFHNARSDCEAVAIDKYAILFKSFNDTYFYVIGDYFENELILATILDNFHESMNILLRGHVDTANIISNLEIALLCIDEICDGGSILETDVGNITSRVSMRGGTGEPGGGSGPNLGDMTISQAFLHSAREHLVKMGQRDGL